VTGRAPLTIVVGPSVGLRLPRRGRPYDLADDSASVHDLNGALPAYEPTLDMAVDGPDGTADEGR
jgi:hypothetical protein